MLEKVEKSMRMIARNQCETYYTRTIKEVDDEVQKLRTEFNQLINGGGYPYFQRTGQLTNNSNNNLINSNQLYQYPYALKHTKL